MSKIRFETFDRVTFFGRRYFFRIVREGNNEIMSTSQPYKQVGSRDIGISVIKAGAGEARIIEGKRA